MDEDWLERFATLLDAPSPAVLTTYRQDGTALTSPVWFRFHDSALEVVIAEGDVKLRHLQHRAECALVVFETVPPFRGVEVHGEADIVRGDVAPARAAIAGRYLGAGRVDVRAPAQQARRPGPRRRLSRACLGPQCDPAAQPVDPAPTGSWGGGAGPDLRSGPVGGCSRWPGDARAVGLTPSGQRLRPVADAVRRVRAPLERDRALERVGLLARAGEVLVSGRDPHAVCRPLVSLVVPTLTERAVARAADQAGGSSPTRANVPAEMVSSSPTRRSARCSSSPGPGQLHTQLVGGDRQVGDVPFEDHPHAATMSPQVKSVSPERL